MIGLWPDRLAPHTSSFRPLLVSLSEEDQASKGHLVDALALRGDEGRGTLRKAAGRGERPVIRRYPNGATPSARRIPD